MTLTQTAGAALLMAIAVPVQTPPGPPVPYEDAGACPGEGCVYREWTACLGKIVEKSQTAWWVQLRNSKGQVGWTNQPEKFGGKDAIADGR